MSAAEESAFHLHAMTDYFALTVFADGRHSLDGTLEAIECMAGSGRDQFETFIVFIAANFTGSHGTLISRIKCETTTGEMPLEHPDVVGSRQHLPFV
jgi:hypothetical protein